MSNLLQIKASIFSSQGESSRLVDLYVAAWKSKNPNGLMSLRDLAVQPIPHLSSETIKAFATPAEKRTADRQRLVDASDELIAEIRNADEIVIGLPMYNFGIPSALQSYFDNIARSGITFRYSESGPVGLLTGKRAVVIATRGGQHEGSTRDSASQQVRTFLNFVGITDVDFVYAEGLNIDPTRREAAISTAKSRIQALGNVLELAA